MLEFERLGRQAEFQVRRAVEVGPRVLQARLEVPEREGHGAIYGHRWLGSPIWPLRVAQLVPLRTRPISAHSVRPARWRQTWMFSLGPRSAALRGYGDIGRHDLEVLRRVNELPEPRDHAVTDIEDVDDLKVQLLAG